MTSPTKPSLRSNAHSLHGYSGIGFCHFLGNNKFRGNHMFDLSREAAPLFDCKDESEQSGRDHFRRMQMVAIGIWNIAGFDGFSLRAGKQMTVRHGRTSQSVVHSLVPSGAYRASSVDSDSQLLPSVDNREGA